MVLSFESFQPISREPLSEGIYQSFQKAILGARLSPGEHIRELQVSRAFDISQGPVREALKGLEQEGLVDRIPQEKERERDGKPPERDDWSGAWSIEAAVSKALDRALGSRNRIRKG